MDENTAPSGYRHLSDAEIMQCLTLDKIGWSQRAIANEVKVNRQSSPQRVQLRNLHTTQAPSRPTRKTTKEDDRHLIMIAKRHYDLAFRDITNLSCLPISAKTVSRRCKEVDLVSRYARRKPYLKPKHKKERIQWATKYINYMVEDWSKVIFSDEYLMKVGFDT